MTVILTKQHNKYTLLCRELLTSPSNSICTLVTPYTVVGRIMVKSGHITLGESGPNAPIVLGQNSRSLWTLQS